MVNLDTHIIVDAVHGKLRPGELKVLDDFWAISGIVLWEIGLLEREGRIGPILDNPAFNRLLRSMTVYPIDREVARMLRRLDYRSDPADEIIGATSLRWDIPLLTRDSRILASKVVPLALR